MERLLGIRSCQSVSCSHFIITKIVNLKRKYLYRSEVNENCPDVVIEYYESRCPINQKSDSLLKSASTYQSDVIENPQQIREEKSETEVAETKKTSENTETTTESGEGGTTEDLPFLEKSEKTTTPDNDLGNGVNAAFSINVDDTNSVQVSYSLPLIENQPGEDLMDTQISSEQESRDTSNCHMPDLMQDVEMQ